MKRNNNMLRLSARLAPTLVIAAGFPLQSALADGMALEINLGKQLAEVDVAEFSTAGVEAKVAYYPRPQVAIEVYAGTGLDDDEDLDLSYQVNYVAGAQLRLESPVRKDTRVYLTGGYGLIDVELDRSGTGKPGSEDFDGFTYGAGLEIRPFRVEQLWLTFGAKRYYGDNGIDLDSGSIGLRWMLD